MPALMPCPDPHELERYLLGLTEEPEASRLDEHVSSCQRCASAAGERPAADEFTEALRHAPERLRELPDDDAIEHLIARIKRLHERPDAPALAFSSVEADEAHATDEIFEFLSPPEAPGELGRLGPYHVVRVLGAGGMGIVFEAKDPHLGRSVALKVMQSSRAALTTARARFLREARAVAALEHDHIVPIYQAGEDRGVPYLAMPLLKGEPLDQRLQRAGVLPTAEALRIAREAALGLAAAHAKGLIHRDVKPANIWLEAGSGRVKLLDFGLVRAADADATALTHSGAIAGTPHYMSPEQARGAAVTPSTDLFSLGCVFYHMLTGRPPFQGTDAVSTLLRVAEAAPEAPTKLVPDTPAAASALALRLLSKAPQDRPESAQAVAEAIAAIERALDSPPPRRAPRRPVALAATAALLLVASGFVLTLQTREGRLVLTVNVPGAQVAIDGRPAQVRVTSPHDAVTIAIPSGRHELLVTRDGFTAYTKEFTIARAGKQEIAARLEPVADEKAVAVARPVAPASHAPIWPETPADRPRPFVLVRASSAERAEFAHLPEALAAYRSGEIINVYGNGPFAIPPVRLENKALTLRAAPGYRPQFVPLAGTPDAPGVPWFQALNAPFTVEGCDFADTRCPTFSASGAPLELRRCRILKAVDRAILYQGRRLRVEDCVLATGWLDAVKITGAGTDAEFRNNVVCLSGTAGFATVEPGAAVRLYNNTIAATSQNTNYLLVLPAGDAPLRIDAEANVFQVRRLIDFRGRSYDALRAQLKWQGRNNVYTNWTGSFLSYGADDSTEFEPAADPAAKLAAWARFWGHDEPGSRGVDAPRFAWSKPAYADPDTARGLLRRRAETFRSRPGFADLGPDWSLVGPGEPYVRALRANKALASEAELRPEPAEGGPFVLLAKGHEPGGYPTCQLAMDAAGDGDTVEVRGDRPFPGVAGGNKRRRLTLRAAPGYRPVIERGEIAAATDSLAIEGFHFRNATIIAVPTLSQPGRGGRITRVANCSFEWDGPAWTPGDDKHLLPIRGLQGIDGTPAEMVNCIAVGWGRRGRVEAYLKTGQSVSIRNSVFKLSLAVFDGGDHAVEFDRCYCWAPSSPFDDDAAVLSWQGHGTARVRASRTLFEVDQPVWLRMLEAPTPDGPDLAAWNGAHNVYSIGQVSWFRVNAKPSEPCIGFDAWKARPGVREDRSIAVHPIVYDPLAWRLPPSEGQVGADVDRIAHTAPGTADGMSGGTDRE